MAKSRKVRSDILVGNLEKKLGLEPGAIRNPDGSDARSNKKLATLRKEFSEAKGNQVKTNPTISNKSLAKASKAVRAVTGLGTNVVPKAKSVAPKTVSKAPIKKNTASKPIVKPKAVNTTKSVSATKLSVKPKPATATKPKAIKPKTSKSPKKNG